MLLSLENIKLKKTVRIPDPMALTVVGGGGRRWITETVSALNKNVINSELQQEATLDKAVSRKTIFELKPEG